MAAGMERSNVAVLLVGTLITGVIIGLGIGRRQGLEIKQVALPADMHSMGSAPGGGAPDANSEEAMKSTAPPPVTSLEEARTMVSGMGNAPAEELLSLGDRKYGNGKWFMAAAFYEAALAKEPDHAKAWLNLAQAYDRLGESAKAAEAYKSCLAHKPDAETAAEARRHVK